MSPDCLMFFSPYQKAKSSYILLEESLMPDISDMLVIVYDDHISFRGKSEFGGVWPVTGGDAVLDAYFILPAPMDASRVTSVTEQAPGKFYHHVTIGGTADVDEELLTWFRNAHDAINA